MNNQSLFNFPSSFWIILLLIACNVFLANAENVIQTSNATKVSRTTSELIEAIDEVAIEKTDTGFCLVIKLRGWYEKTDKNLKKIKELTKALFEPILPSKVPLYVEVKNCSFKGEECLFQSISDDTISTLTDSIILHSVFQVHKYNEAIKKKLDNKNPQFKKGYKYELIFNLNNDKKKQKLCFNFDS